MAKTPKPENVNQDYSDKETAKRRDEGLRNLLKTPPKPQADITGKSAASKSSKQKANSQSAKE
tara:strand:- start:1873 stop:2061 length:189 start_codon:yes stop_codon:yes gene_type:complete